MIIWLEVLFKKVKNLYILDILIYSSLNWPQLFYAFYWCNLDNYGLELNQKKKKNLKILEYFTATLPQITEIKINRLEIFHFTCNENSRHECLTFWFQKDKLQVIRQIPHRVPLLEFIAIHQELKRKMCETTYRWGRFKRVFRGKVDSTGAQDGSIIQRRSASQWLLERSWAGRQHSHSTWQTTCNLLPFRRGNEGSGQGSWDWFLFHGAIDKMHGLKKGN